MNATQQPSPSKLFFTVFLRLPPVLQKAVFKKEESKVKARRRGSIDGVVEVRTLVTRVQLQHLRSLQETFPQEMGTRKTQEPRSRD